MKKSLIALLITLPIIAFPVTAIAGSDKDNSAHNEFGRRHMDRAMKKLNLSAEQDEKLKAAFESHHKKMVTLREETEKEINTILTPEQQKKLQNMKEKRKEKWAERKENAEKRYDEKPHRKGSDY